MNFPALPYLKCLVRGKEVMAKPEEIVRQLWLQHPHPQIQILHAARQRAQALLAKAKRAMEVAIEEGEEKA